MFFYSPTNNTNIHYLLQQILLFFSYGNYASHAVWIWFTSHRWHRYLRFFFSHAQEIVCTRHSTSKLGSALVYSNFHSFFDALFLAALKKTRYWLTQIFTRFARSTDNSWQSMIPSPHFSTTTPKTEKNIIQQTLCISHSVCHYYIIHYLIFYDIAV